MTEEYKKLLNDYINELNGKKTILQEESLERLKNYKGNVDGFFGIIKGICREYDCIEVCVNENKSLLYLSESRGN